MKRLIMTLLAATLSTACDRSEVTDITVSGDMPKREKPSEVSEGFQKLNFDPSSKSGDVVIAENPGGLSLIAGDLGVWANGDKIRNFKLGSTGSHIAMDINNQNNWIAAGSKGVFVNQALQPGVDLGTNDSHYAVSINTHGHWIAAGNGRVYIKRAGSPTIIPNLNVVNSVSKLTAKLFDDGTWVIASDMGVWTGARSASGDESLLQQDPAKQFRPLSASQ